MKKQTIQKLFVLIVTVLMVLMALSQICYALTPSNVTPTEPTQSGDIADLGGRIIGALQTIGVVLAVVLLGILGIKYMIGSAEEKADYKKSMIPYLVGAAVLFLAPTIANIVYTFITNGNSNG